MAAPHPSIYWVSKKGASVLTNLDKSDKLTKDCAERAMALDDFKQSTKIANLLSVDKAELNRIIENIYNGGGIDD